MFIKPWRKPNQILNRNNRKLEEKLKIFQHINGLHKSVSMFILVFVLDFVFEYLFSATLHTKSEFIKCRTGPAERCSVFSFIM